MCPSETVLLPTAVAALTEQSTVTLEGCKSTFIVHAKNRVRV